MTADFGDFAKTDKNEKTKDEVKQTITTKRDFLISLIYQIYINSIAIISFTKKKNFSEKTFFKGAFTNYVCILGWVVGQKTSSLLLT